MRRTPIRKRAPKRKPELVDKAYCDWTRERGCAITLYGTTMAAREHMCDSPITVHHVRSHGSPRDDRKILALCASGHLHDAGMHSVERGKAQFERWWGFAIEETALDARRRYEQELKGVYGF